MNETLTKHPCAVPDCEERLTGDATLCRGHFRSVPMKLRRVAWKAREQGTDSAAYKAAIAAILTAIAERTP